MGNHDYIDLKFDVDKSRKRFYNYMKSYPYSHYIINNFNFIFWSNDNSGINNTAIKDYSWIKKTLEKARKIKNKKGDPIFVVTHMHPKKTCYGSENIWGYTGITNILKDYPEVICISGHSHYSLRNTKSIWQGNFTVINTQSLSYVDLDKFYVNAKDVRADSAKKILWV
jgi:Icc-related predicted phosphoesterase